MHLWPGLPNCRGGLSQDELQNPWALLGGPGGTEHPSHTASLQKLSDPSFKGFGSSLSAPQLLLGHHWGMWVALRGTDGRLPSTKATHSSFVVKEAARAREPGDCKYVVPHYTHTHSPREWQKCYS